MAFKCWLPLSLLQRILFAPTTFAFSASATSTGRSLNCSAIASKNSANTTEFPFASPEYRPRRVGNGVQASVAPEKVLSSSPMGRISGTSSYIYFETDIFPGLAITEENPGLYATAYGMLADFVRT